MNEFNIISKAGRYCSIEEIATGLGIGRNSASVMLRKNKFLTKIEVPRVSRPMYLYGITGETPLPIIKTKEITKKQEESNALRREVYYRNKELREAAKL